MTIRKLASRMWRAGRRHFAPPVRLKWEVTPEEKEVFANQARSDLAKLFFRHHGRNVYKWMHYLEIYERHFAQFLNTPVKMLEIGVFKGGSLEMWREYFGDDATIFGIDIDPDCANRVRPPNQVRIGSQDDPGFLRSVISEMGAPDIILDDGSHIGRHQRISFDTLFPMLKYGGVYVIEDLHTSYWKKWFKGGYRRSGTAVAHIKEMIDDLHAWYHNHPTTTPAKDEIGAIHIYDSIVVIEKRQKHQPVHIRFGSEP